MGNSHIIGNTKFNLPGQKQLYQGKVRDVYHVGDQYLIMVASDRISAFDHILPRPIPFKGQVLNQIAAINMDATGDIVPNWILSTPDPRVSIGLKCEPFKIEMVIRGYLAGHAWREYKAGKRMVSGAIMPDGMKESDRFPQPLITPATKADSGHDEDISRQEILDQGIVNEHDLNLLESYTLKLFQRGTEIAAKQGLILVDTKYEFGKSGDRIYLIDEIHTPDSSRYYYAEGYEERQVKGMHQQQLSKEFVREWLMENGFQGLEGQTMPTMPDEFVKKVSDRYIHLYEHLAGSEFNRSYNSLAKIEENIIEALDNLQ